VSFPTVNVAAGVDMAPIILPPPPPRMPCCCCGGLAVGMDVARSTLMGWARRGGARCVVVDMAGLDMARLDAASVDVVMLLWAVTWHARMVGKAGA